MKFIDFLITMLIVIYLLMFLFTIIFGTFELMYWLLVGDFFHPIDLSLNRSAF